MRQPHRILHKRRVIIAVRMRNRIPEILHIIPRHVRRRPAPTRRIEIPARHHRMRPSPQRRQFQPPMHRSERPRIHHDVIEDVLPPKQRRKIVVIPRPHHVAAKLPFVPTPAHAHRLRQVQPVLARLSRQYRRLSHVIDPVINLRFGRRRVGQRLLQVPRKLCPEMARPPRRQAARQRHRRALRPHFFLPIPAHRVVRYRARRVQKNIIRPVIPRRAHPQRQQLPRPQHAVQLQKSRVAQHVGPERPSLRRKLRRRRRHIRRNARRLSRLRRRASRHNRLVARRPANPRIAFLEIANQRIRPLRHHRHRAIVKFHHRRQVKNMLIVSRKKEHLIALDRPPNRPSKLVLHPARIESHKRRRRPANPAVPQVIKRAPMPRVRARLRHHIHHRPARPP